MKNVENQSKYALLQKEKRFRENTRLSVFFQKLNKKEKTCGPVNYNGRRMKQDFETGEIRFYELEEILANKRNSVSRTKQLLQDLLAMNDFDWFCTFTFDNQKIKRDSEENIYKAYERFINNIQHQFPTLRYVTVLELHKDGHIHFHMLLAGVPWQKLCLENTGKVCCHWATRKNNVCSLEYFNRTKHLYELTPTDGHTVYNITTFIYGYTTATRIVNQEACKNYVAKYVEKALGSASMFKKSFYYSSNLRVPEEVTKCVGADFDVPKNTLAISKADALFKNALSVGYDEDYNIAFATIDNNIIDNIKKGLIPVKETTPFDSEVK